MAPTTIAQLDGITRLRRIETFLDVGYAALFVHFLAYLPVMEDGAWMDLPYGLLTLLIEDWDGVLRLLVGASLTLVSWSFTHKLLGPLSRSDGKHMVLVLLQFSLVMLFLYFAVADPDLKSLSSPIGQSLCLAASGFTGVAGWDYARKHGFVRAGLTPEDLGDRGHRIWLEPMTALLNAPVALLGPIAWTIGWIVIPLGLTGLKKARARGSKD